MRFSRWCALFLVLLSGCAQPGGSQPAAEGMAELPTAATSDRKIVYHGELHVVVPKIDAFETELKRILETEKGFVAAFVEHRQQGVQRRAEWTLRIPAGRFQAVADQLGALGSPVRRELLADDVTDAYIDLEARLAGQRRLEERLLTLLDKQAGDLSEVLRVETELSRVRQEIERLEAQHRAMKDRVALSTLVVMAIEQPDYVPLDELSTGEKMAFAFSASLQALWQTLEALLMLLACFAPWLMLLALIVAPVVMFVRWRWRRKPRLAGQA